MPELERLLMILKIAQPFWEVRHQEKAKCLAQVMERPITTPDPPGWW